MFGRVATILTLPLATWLAACGGAAAPGAPAAPAVPAPAASAPASRAADPPTAAPPVSVKLDMPHGGRGVAGLAHYLAVEDGWYARQGIEVTSSNVPNSSVLLAALISGDVPIATTGQEAAINAVLGGAEVVIVGAQLSGVAVSIMAQPEHRAAADLRGRRIGVTAHASPTHTGAVLYLRANGLVPGRDVAVTPIGGMPEIRGALESGALDAAVISPPLSYALLRAGFSELADLATSDLPYHQGTLMTTRSYARDHPDIVRRILLGYAQAQRAVLEDREAALRVLAKWVGVNDADELERTYTLAQRGFRFGPSVDPASVQTSIDLLAETEPAARALRAEQLIDNTFAAAASPTTGFAPR